MAKNQLRAHREELQRVQIGLVGLAAVLLVVTLANLVIQTARNEAGLDTASTDQTLQPNGQVNSSGGSLAGPSEPLADLGVTPSTADPVAPSVPDLEPDPKLRERMDRDPNQSSSR